LSSINGPDKTILDAIGKKQSAIYVGNGQKGVVIDNIQIRNGWGSKASFNTQLFGGGILIDESVKAVVKNCLIIRNGIPPETEYSGGMFISYGSEVHLFNNTISDNYGPGIWWRSNPFLKK
jgi:hypothetical protein